MILKDNKIVFITIDQQYLRALFIMFAPINVTADSWNKTTGVLFNSNPTGAVSIFVAVSVV